MAPDERGRAYALHFLGARLRTRERRGASRHQAGEHPHRAGGPAAPGRDFGIVRVSRVPGGTLAGEIVGTPEFMSPEQCAGDDTVGERPLFAWHSRLPPPYRNTPIQRTDIRSILTRHMTTEPRPLREVRADLPVHLVATIARCLAKEREARFTNAEALSQALEESMDVPRVVPLPIRTYLQEVPPAPVGNAAAGEYCVCGSVRVPPDPAERPRQPHHRGAGRGGGPGAGWSRSASKFGKRARW